MTTDAELRTAIAEILEDADINTITAKKVRAELETKLKTDLSSKKKEIDKLVMDIINAKNDKVEDEESEEEEVEDKPAKKRGRQPKKASDSDSDDGGSSKKKKPAKGGGRGGGGYTRVCKLSPELAAVMGEPAMARHEVVKRMWKIVKEKNLYDPKNKQFAICNDELFAVFGIKRFRTFGMMKYLKDHFVD